MCWIGARKAYAPRQKELAMLVLSRKSSESIRIGDEIVVTVLGIQGNRVRIGVEAPVQIVVRRTELVPKNAGPLDFPSSVAGVLADVRVG